MCNYLVRTKSSETGKAGYHLNPFPSRFCQANLTNHDWVFLYPEQFGKPGLIWAFNSFALFDDDIVIRCDQSLLSASI
jgi:hypothetical protein